MSVCHICSACPCLRISLYTSGLSQCCPHNFTDLEMHNVLTRWQMPEGWESGVFAVEGNYFIVQSLHSSMTMMLMKKHLGSTTKSKAAEEE